MIKNKGFSLIEILVSLAVSMIIISVLFRLYSAQIKLSHHIDDLIFLDHNGVLAMQILAQEVRSAHSIKLFSQQNKIIFTSKSAVQREKMFYINPGFSGLFIKSKNKLIINTYEFISGVSQLDANWINKKTLRIKISLQAPYGKTAVFSEKIIAENI